MRIKNCVTLLQSSQDITFLHSVSAEMIALATECRKQDQQKVLKISWKTGPRVVNQKHYYQFLRQAEGRLANTNAAFLPLRIIRVTITNSPETSHNICDKNVKINAGQMSLYKNVLVTKTSKQRLFYMKQFVNNKQKKECLINQDTVTKYKGGRVWAMIRFHEIFHSATLCPWSRKVLTRNCKPITDCRTPRVPCSCCPDRE